MAKKLLVLGDIMSDYAGNKLLKLIPQRQLPIRSHQSLFNKITIYS